MNSIGNLTTSWLAFLRCNNFGAYAPISWFAVILLGGFFLRALMRKIIILGLCTILMVTFLYERTKKLLTKRSYVGARGLCIAPCKGETSDLCIASPKGTGSEPSLKTPHEEELCGR
jgi:hypothetical protein